MKRLLLIVAILMTTACDRSPKTLEELKAAIAAKEASGGYPTVDLPAVCVNGVLYYKSVTHSGWNTFAPVINRKDRLPQLCVNANPSPIGVE